MVDSYLPSESIYPLGSLPSQKVNGETEQEDTQEMRKNKMRQQSRDRDSKRRERQKDKAQQGNPLLGATQQP